ncbi:MAG TPA: hypothetical protein VMH34_02635 [Gammaproteobacteria bacterium]|nr:hypothetical protein [Gammaproteobacteria bacterium]
MLWTVGHEEWGPRLVIAAAICFIASMVCFLWPLIRNIIKCSSRTDYMIPLKDAARSIYQDLRTFDNQHAHLLMAGDGHESQNHILEYFAICIFQHANILGKHPPSNVPEKITPEELARGLLIDGGDAFKKFDKKEPEYTDLVVDKRELPRILNLLKSQI